MQHEMRIGQMKMQDFCLDDQNYQTEYEQILEMIRENPSITICELSEKMYYTENKIKRVIRECKESSRLIRMGSSRSGYWKVN